MTAPASRSVIDRQSRALVRADREQRAAVVEILRLDRRASALVDDPALRHLLALVERDHQLAFGDRRRRDVEDRGIGAGERHADRERIGGEPAVAAAERRDAHRARRVEKMQRHLARGGGDLGPVAETSEVTAVAQTDHRDAGLRRFRDAEAGCELAHHLAEAAIAVDDRERVAVEHDRRRRIGLEPARAHPFEVFADAQHAVRIVPDKIGVDEALGDRARLRFAGAAGLHDRGNDGDELRGSDSLHLGPLSEFPVPASAQCLRGNRNRILDRPA